MRAFVAILFSLVAATATATELGHAETSLPRDGGVTGGLLITGALLSLIQVDRNHLWQSELLSLDEPVKRNFSIDAAHLSDITVNIAVVLPVATLFSGHFDRPYGDSMLLYAQALAGSFALNAVAKYTVQRPRPYNYSDDPAIRKWATEQGGDSHVSFYSGHSAMSFTAAVAAATLLASHSDDYNARAVVWGVGLGLASFTAGMRVRAGRHYISDVAIGAVLGAGMGFAIPYLHAARPQDGWHTQEFVGIAGGLLLGSLGAALMHRQRDILQPLDTPKQSQLLRLPKLHWAPTVVDGRLGLALGAVF